MIKPINRITIIKEKDTSEFVKNFNDNKISNKLLESCKKLANCLVEESKKIRIIFVYFVCGIFN